MSRSLEKLINSLCQGVNAQCPVVGRTVRDPICDKAVKDAKMEYKESVDPQLGNQHDGATSLEYWGYLKSLETVYVKELIKALSAVPVKLRSGEYGRPSQHAVPTLPLVSKSHQMDQYGEISEIALMDVWRTISELTKRNLDKELATQHNQQPGASRAVRVKNLAEFYIRVLHGGIKYVSIEPAKQLLESCDLKASDYLAAKAVIFTVNQETVAENLREKYEKYIVEAAFSLVIKGIKDVAWLGKHVCLEMPKLGWLLFDGSRFYFSESSIMEDDEESIVQHMESLKPHRISSLHESWTPQKKKCGSTGLRDSSSPVKMLQLLPETEFNQPAEWSPERKKYVVDRQDSLKDRMCTAVAWRFIRRAKTEETRTHIKNIASNIMSHTAESQTVSPDEELRFQYGWRCPQLQRNGTPLLLPIVPSWYEENVALNLRSFRQNCYFMNPATTSMVKRRCVDVFSQGLAEPFLFTHTEDGQLASTLDIEVSAIYEFSSNTSDYCNF